MHVETRVLIEEELILELSVLLVNSATILLHLKLFGVPKIVQQELVLVLELSNYLLRFKITVDNE